MKSGKKIFKKLKSEFIHFLKTEDNNFKIYTNNNKIIKTKENLLIVINYIITYY